MAKPALFMAELAKSGAATCKVCKQKIAKDELRVGVISYFPVLGQYFHEAYPNTFGPFAVTKSEDIDRLYDDHHGWQWRWHHVDCFQFEKFPALKGTDCFVGPNNFGFTPLELLSAAHKNTLRDKIKGGGSVSSAAAKAKAKGKARAEPKAKGKAKAEARAKAVPELAARAGKRAAEAAVGAPPMKAARGAAALAGKTVVFTGAITLKRAEAAAAAAAAGAKVASDVSKSTHIVVAGPGAGSKLAKAESFGVEVWDETKFKQAAGL